MQDLKKAQEVAKAVYEGDRGKTVAIVDAEEFYAQQYVSKVGRSSGVKLTWKKELTSISIIDIESATDDVEIGTALRFELESQKKHLKGGTVHSISCG